jgi:hypothetical protein
LAYRILMDELDNLKSNSSKCDCKKWWAYVGIFDHS